MKIGTIVKLKCPILGNLTGTVGVCYETYSIGNKEGSSFIFENGEYDGFNAEEQSVFLERSGYYKFDYIFTNVIQLSNDFRKGVFDNHLKIFGR